MNVVQDRWEAILTHIKINNNLSNTSYNTWIAPLTLFEVTDDTLYIMVKNVNRLSYIEQKFLEPFMDSVSAITGTKYQISFVTENTDIPKKKKEKPVSTKKDTTIFERANLNKRHTFETFVVGKTNNFAHAASYAVSEKPGEVYNPFFIYGGAGLGKTHLMQSIAHRILENDPTKKVLYVTSESFTNELINTIMIGKTGNELAMTSFREKYRNNDVLLVDDIQFIHGKAATQEEFFHTFNHLHQSGKQVIISSDRPPKDLETLDTRLRSRFSWGLSADIQPPDFETRMAILNKRIELDHLTKYKISYEVIDYIANHIDSNIRELEGSLKKLIALHNLEKKPIDIPLAAEALKDIVTKSRVLSEQLILDTVAEHYQVSVADIISPKRNKPFIEPRFVFIYLCYNLLEITYEAIGLTLERNYTTIMNGYDKIDERIKTDEVLKNNVETIKKKLNPN